MVLVCIEKCFERKESILTAKGGGATELKSCPMKFKESKSTTIYDRRKDLAANIHEHDAVPLVRIRKVA